MNHTIEDVALTVLASMMMRQPAGDIVSSDRMIKRAFRVAEEFIAECDRRRAEVERLTDEVRDHD